MRGGSVAARSVRKCDKRQKLETRDGFFDMTLRFVRRIMHHRPAPEKPWDAMQWQHFWGNISGPTNARTPATSRPANARTLCGRRF